MIDKFCLQVRKHNDQRKGCDYGHGLFLYMEIYLCEQYLHK